MQTQSTQKLKGFTLIEMAIALGILGLLSVVISALFLKTVDTYGLMANDTDSTKQARQALEMISREMREARDTSMSDPAAGAILGSIRDALLLSSARLSNGTFAVNGSYQPTASSIVLFYLNTTAEGVNQLVRHQLYYADDLSALTPPFSLANPAYSGANIVIRDNLGNNINVNRQTGAVGGAPALTPPKILMNRATSFDAIAATVTTPAEVRVTCQILGKYNRGIISCRLRTQIDPRNM